MLTRLASNLPNLLNVDITGILPPCPALTAFKKGRARREQELSNKDLIGGRSMTHNKGVALLGKQ